VNVTKTQAFLIGGAIGVVVGVLGSLIHTSAPKDTPIVIVGGSIHGKTDSNDTSGWVPSSGNSYQGTVHRDPKNNNGIDRLQFNNLEGNPATMTNTGGWAITVANTDKNHNAVKKGALKFCSDTTCTASTDLMDGSPNKNQCGSIFAQFGNVYLGARKDSRLEEVKSGAIIRELHYHDQDPDCDGPNGTGESKCDWPMQFTVETCNPLTSKTYSCMGTGCSVQVGTN